MENLNVGSIVKYAGGYYRISADRGTDDKRWFNLASIFGTKIYHKQIPATAVVEAHQEWYDRWTQSETYQCM